MRVGPLYHLELCSANYLPFFSGNSDLRAFHFLVFCLSQHSLLHKYLRTLPFPTTQRQSVHNRLPCNALARNEHTLDAEILI